ncbi:hypothetical protein Tco_0937645 [Tanacetum coccineum]|uniref:Uncharacterized protein n=1 Tax=Tanacetum coccineum TaxID=301880 RepID=A0ABQ5DFJ5_9ASTR
MMVQDQEEMGKGSKMPTDPHHTPTIIQPSTLPPQRNKRSRRSKRTEIAVPLLVVPTTNVADDGLADKGHIDNDPIQGTHNASVHQELVHVVVPGNTLQSGKDRLKLEELMALCTTLQSRVLALETTKTTQATKIAKGWNLEVKTDEDMFGVNDLDSDEVIVESVDVINTAEEIRSVVEEVTTITIPSVKPKATTITTTLTITTTAATTITAVSTRPRAKGLVIHEQEKAPTPRFFTKHPHRVKVKDKAEEEEEERLARAKAQQMEEANIAWDDVQAKINANYQLAQRLQAQEEDELTDEEKARLTELLEESSKKAETEQGKENNVYGRINKDYLNAELELYGFFVAFIVVHAADAILSIGLRRYPLTSQTTSNVHDVTASSLIYECDLAFELLDLVTNSLRKDRDDDNKDEDPFAGPNQGKKTKRSRTKESEPSKKSSTTKELSKGKSPAKTSKSGKSVTTKEPLEEPAFEMPHYKILKQTIMMWSKMPPTPDLEWNTVQAVDDAQEKTWFNDMSSAVKDPLTFSGTHSHSY